MANGGKQKKFVRVLYAPKCGNDLRSQYPELSNYEEFSKISKEELLLAWYYAVIFKGVRDPKERMYMSLRDTYGQNLDDELARKYIDGNYPIGVREAIKRFDSFTLNERLKALSMAQKTVANFEKILETSIDGLIAEGKWKDIKDWQSVVTDINKEMPDLIKRIEDGYGTAEVYVTNGEKAVNVFYERKLSNTE